MKIAGLNSYLNKNYENLYTVDILCHGVASPKVFQKYLGWIEEKIGKIKYYNFRSKVFGWGKVCEIKTDKKHRYVSVTDPYNKNFFAGNIFRECCYECKYAQLKRVSDITIADYWGIQKRHSAFYDKNGVSALLINSIKGKKMFEKISENISYISTDINFIKEENENLNQPVQRPHIRDSIYEGILTLSDVEYVEKKLMPFITKKDYLRALVPFRIKYWIKRNLKKF